MCPQNECCELNMWSPHCSYILQKQVMAETETLPPNAECSSPDIVLRKKNTHTLCSRGNATFQLSWWCFSLFFLTRIRCSAELSKRMMCQWQVHLIILNLAAPHLGVHVPGPWYCACCQLEWLLTPEMGLRPWFISLVVPFLLSLLHTKSVRHKLVWKSRAWQMTRGQALDNMVSQSKTFMDLLYITCCWMPTVFLEPKPKSIILSLAFVPVDAIV